MEKGLAETPAVGTTPAPKTMYEEMEQDENVARGCVRVKELIAYDKIGEKKNDVGKVTDIERPHKPCFCQTAEQETVFAENNSTARIETFTIQLLKSTAIKFLNDPENMKQFEKKGKDGV